MGTATPPRAGRAKKVLIADDDAGIVDALRFMLEDDGYEVVAIASGDVVDKAEREQPDVLLLDIRLSGQDGREICRALKRQAATSRIPVIVVSADRTGAEKAREAGADDFLGKPFELDDLLAMVARYAGSGNVPATP